MSQITINLGELVSPPNTDSISGRDFGKTYAKKKKVISHLKEGDVFVVYIDSNVKAINDSFIKGFFSEVFNELKTKNNVKKYFQIEGNEFFKKLIDKNWTLLEAINAA